MSKIFFQMVLAFCLVACGGRVVVDEGAGGSGGSLEATTSPASTSSSSSSSSSGAGGTSQGGGTPDGGAGAGGEGPCGAAALDACKAQGSDCIPGSDCYNFKACYENVQTDPAAVQACVDADPAGAASWADLVACECACEWAPAGFCDGSAYGHPHG